MRGLLPTTTAALLLALAAVPARGQGTWGVDVPLLSPREEARGWTLSYAFAYARPEGTSAKGGSFGVQASLERKLASVLAGGLEFGYWFSHQLEGRMTDRYRGDLDGDGPQEELKFTSDVKEKVLQLTPILRIGKPFWESGEMSLLHYVVLGAGYYHRQNGAGTFSVTGRTSTGRNLDRAAFPYQGYRKDHLGANFGTGLGWQVIDGLRLSVDIRYHYLFAGGAEDIRFITPSGRLSFSF